MATLYTCRVVRMHVADNVDFCSARVSQCEWRDIDNEWVLDRSGYLSVDSGVQWQTAIQLAALVHHASCDTV